MTNFVKDNTGLGDAKLNFALRPDIPPERKIRSVDWNTMRQAALDIQGFLRGASWYGLASAPEDPAPSGVSKYLWLTEDGELRLTVDGDAVPVGSGGTAVSVASHGAVGDGVTDDTASIQAAIEAAIADRAELFLPAGVYKTTGYLDVFGATSLRIRGEGATVLYPSDDTGVVADSIAVTDEMARSAMILRYCTGVVVQGVTFEGGTSPKLSDNLGAGIYATHCVGTLVQGCTGIHGYSLFSQDAQANSTGTGDSLTYSDGVVTLVDAAAPFSPGHAKRQVTVAGATNQSNNGSYVIESVVSATTITYRNAGGVTETSDFRWVIDDADRGSRVVFNTSLRQRGFIRTGNDSFVGYNLIERPLNVDNCGIGDSFVVGGPELETITLTDQAARFNPSYVGKLITIADATSGGNEGVFPITAVLSSTQLTYTNASGVTEPFTGTWWIANGDKVGRGDGVGALAFSGGLVTVTSAEAAFVPSDVDKVMRIQNAPSAANCGAFVITDYISSTQVKVSNASGVSENFDGIWSIDEFDNGIASGTHGSSHGIYIFAGRSNILVEGNTFRGIRTTCVKVSGSSLPIRNIVVRDNYAEECGALFVGGGDDLQEHTGMVIDNNTCVDVATGTSGRSLSVAVSLLGSRGTKVTNNRFLYRHNAIGSVDANGFAGNRIIECSGGGLGQPLEDLTIEGNKVAMDPQSTTSGFIAPYALRVLYAGLVSKANTGGTLTKSGDTMTLTESAAWFSSQDVGKLITLVNSAGGNNGAFRVTKVPSSTTIEYVNAGGTGAGSSAGTWRMSGNDGHLGSSCRIAYNQLAPAAGVWLNTISCVGPDIVDNVVNNAQANLDGDCAPRFTRNRELATNTMNARIRLGAGSSWPIVYDNTITNQYLGTTAGRDMGISVSAAPETPVDHPLLGKRGRMKVTASVQQVVISYGSQHVDGDYVTVQGTTLTYKASAPGGTQFNSMSDPTDGLIAKINAIAGVSCVEYGTHLTDSVETEHLLITLDDDTQADGTLIVTTDALHPTALVFLHNSNAPNQTCIGRGAGSTPGTGDRSVVWSPLSTFSGGAMVWADNDDAMTLLASDGWRPEKNANDAGCCEVIKHGVDGGTEEFRWAFP